MRKAILEVRDVSFRHRLSKNEYSEAVLNKVSLTVPEGEILVLAGPSGSGKTTLLRLLNRLEDPEEGMILYHGDNIKTLCPQKLRREVSLVRQEPFLVEGTVQDNLLLPLNGRKADSPIDQKIDEILVSVGLSSEVRKRSVLHLSVGEKQRVSIARALMVSPKVILLDEPTSALDPENRKILSDTVRKINETARITFLVVTHIQSFAQSLGGKVLVMKHGEVV
jgi:putative ABC transport system ATP-binding protein